MSYYGNYPSNGRPRPEEEDYGHSPPPSKRPKLQDNNDNDCSALFVAGLPLNDTAAHFSSFFQDAVHSKIGKHVEVVKCTFFPGRNKDIDCMHAKREWAVQAFHGRSLDYGRNRRLSVWRYNKGKSKSRSSTTCTTQEDYYGPTATAAAGLEYQQTAAYDYHGQQGGYYYDDADHHQQQGVLSSNSRVVVFNVSLTATEEQLIAFIDEATGGFVQVADCQFDRKDAKANGYQKAIVRFATLNEAKTAVQALNEKTFLGRSLWARVDLDDKPTSLSARDSALNVYVTNIPWLGSIAVTRRWVKGFFLKHIEGLNSAHDIDAKFDYHMDGDTANADVGFRSTDIVERALELDGLDLKGFRVGVSRQKGGERPTQNNTIVPVAAAEKQAAAQEAADVFRVMDPAVMVFVSNIPVQCPTGFKGIWRSPEDAGEAIKYFLQEKLVTEMGLAKPEDIQVSVFRLFPKEDAYSVLLEFAQKDIAARTIQLGTIEFHGRTIGLSQWKNRVTGNYDSGRSIAVHGIPPPHLFQHSGSRPYYDSVRDQLRQVLRDRMRYQFGIEAPCEWIDVRGKMSSRQPVYAFVQFRDFDVAEKVLQLRDVFLQDHPLSFARLDPTECASTTESYTETHTEPPKDDDPCAIYVRNIPVDATEEELSAFITYKMNRLGAENSSPRCDIRSKRGDAMVAFAHPEHAEVALNRWTSEDRVLRGNLLSIKPWRPKPGQYFKEKATEAGFNHHSDGDYYGQGQGASLHGDAGTNHYCNPDHVGATEGQQYGYDDQPDTLEMSYDVNSEHQDRYESQREDHSGSADILDPGVSVQTPKEKTDGDRSGQDTLADTAHDTNDSSGRSAAAEMPSGNPDTLTVKDAAKTSVKASFADQKVSFADPKVSFADPKVSVADQLSLATTVSTSTEEKDVEVEELRRKLAAALESNAADKQTWEREREAYDSTVAELGERNELLQQLVATEKNAAKEQMESDKKELEKKLTMQLMAKKKAMDDERKSLEAKCKQQSDELEALKRAKESQKTKAAAKAWALTTKVQSLEKQNETLRKSEETLQADVKKEKKAAVKTKKENYAEKRKLEGKIEGLEKEVASLDQAKQTLMKSVADLQASPRKSKKSKKNAVDSDVESLKEQIKKLEQKNAALMEQKEDITNKYLKLSDSNVDDRKRADKLREQLNSEETKRQTLEAQLLLLRTELQIVKKLPDEESNSRRVSIHNNEAAEQHSATRVVPLADDGNESASTSKEVSSAARKSGSTQAGLSAHFTAPRRNSWLKEEQQQWDI